MTITQQASARLHHGWAGILGRLAAVTFLVLAAGAAATSSAAACQWRVPPNFWGTQSNKHAVNFLLTQSGVHLRGSAAHTHHIQRGVVRGRGSADGHIRGNSFLVTVYWAATVVGVYQGTINPQGRITGTTYDQRNPKSRAQWNSDILLTCS